MINMNKVIDTEEHRRFRMHRQHYCRNAAARINWINIPNQDRYIIGVQGALIYMLEWQHPQGLALVPRLKQMLNWQVDDPDTLVAASAMREALEVIASYRELI